MSSLNKAILIGNLGKDPENKRTTNGNSVTTFSIATTEKFQDKSGVLQERTDWHNIVIWGKMADNAAKYLKKGSSVYIEGRISTRSYDDKDGVKKYITEIVASGMQFLNSGRDKNESNEQSNENKTNYESSSVNNFEQVDDLPF